MESQIKFSMVDNIRVSVVPKTDGDIVNYVVKLQCEAPLNISAITRLINMTKARVPISVTFASGQLVLDLKVETVDLRFGEDQPKDLKAPLPESIIGEDPKDDRLAQALGEGGSKEEVTAPGDNGDGPKRRGRPKKEEAVGAGA